MNKTTILLLSTALSFSLVISACSGNKNIKYSYPKTSDEQRETKVGSLIGGEEGFIIFKGGRKKREAGESIGTVNGTLWRASLDVISFMPLTSSDSRGGVIVTDWYLDPQTPNERLKLNILITTPDLRADGIKVTAFKEKLNSKGIWQRVETSPELAEEIENKILTRARQLSILPE